PRSDTLLEHNAPCSLSVARSISRARRWALSYAGSSFAEAKLHSGFGIFLERLSDVGEELVCHRAVDDAMIERYREIRARQNCDRILAVMPRQNLWAFLDCAATED